MLLKYTNGITLSSKNVLRRHMAFLFSCCGPAEVRELAVHLLLLTIPTFDSDIAFNRPRPLEWQSERAHVAADILYLNFCVLRITRLWRPCVNQPEG